MVVLMVYQIQYLVVLFIMLVVVVLVVRDPIRLVQTK